ncbi:hypothetical protein LZG04_19315 [Saccharothrix sp. S26]|uniref:DUF6891 domain-containing protein n=1 Tax=Saccharothrix sp. S26 TaxID=2907215 RepID=UPI001F216F6B|nr:hypothetical protein [Saccharothrix sp. S26]MCE6996935.1 hypothetical protein [Saccharothrix sp. S26]
MVERADDVTDLPADVVAEVEEYARSVVHAGFSGVEDAVERVVDHFADEERPVTEAVARVVVGRVWRERAAEQDGWPERTDVDRLFAAFHALDRGGITARADFTCCQTCGHAEIGDEAREGARGYVFFHQQDTERAVVDGQVWLAYGSFGEAADEAVGREVVAALSAGGLPVEWNGSASTRIKVGPIAWQKRLPVG